MATTSPFSTLLRSHAPQASDGLATRVAALVLSVAVATTGLLAMPIAPAFAQADDQTQQEPGADGDDEAMLPGSITVSLVSDPPAADITLPFFVQGLSHAFPYSYSAGRDLRVGDVWQLGALSPSNVEVLAARGC